MDLKNTPVSGPTLAPHWCRFWSLQPRRITCVAILEVSLVHSEEKTDGDGKTGQWSIEHLNQRTGDHSFWRSGWRHPLPWRPRAGHMLLSWGGLLWSYCSHHHHCLLGHLLLFIFVFLCIRADIPYEFRHGRTGQLPGAASVGGRHERIFGGGTSAFNYDIGELAH